MSGFENHIKSLKEIESEIYRRGLVLNIDWDNPLQMKTLAEEAVHDFKRISDLFSQHPHDPEIKAKSELYALSGLMLKTMTESAIEGFELHGGEVWKHFGKALFEASESK